MKLFNIKQKESLIGLRKYKQTRNKICIVRKTGGYGDILVSRMMFEDIKKFDPEIEITFAIPPVYHQVAANHPYIDKIDDYMKINNDDYLAVYNITNICSGHEAANGKNTIKNRSDIWAEHIGVKLRNHNMFLPHYEKFNDQIFNLWEKQGYKKGQKIVAFSPYSAVPIRNLTEKTIRYIVEKCSRPDIFLYIINSVPLINYSHIPYCRGNNFNEAMALIDNSDCVITTDTGTLHCASGYNIPTIGIFNYVNGKVVGKYYDNLIIVQKNNENDSNWICGPCNDYSKCPHEMNNQVLYCNEMINDEMLDEAMCKLFQKLNLKY